MTEVMVSTKRHVSENTVHHHKIGQFGLLEAGRILQFYHFDDFGSSLAILFEIVSQEGWINVMTSAMAIVGLDENPRMDASPGNAFFFVTFNLLGAVFVLTLVRFCYNHQLYEEIWTCVHDG